MTITQLHYVLAVAEYRNFTVAAENCFVTQPTLSMQIQKLEEELDVKIFDRTKKPIQLTEVGKKIVEQAKSIVNEADRIKDIVEQQKGYIGGEFKIGVLPTVMPTLLPMFLNNFIKKFPKVHLIIEEHPTEEIINRLHKGLLDAAIAATPLNEPGLKEIALYYEPFVGYFPQKFRQGLDFLTSDNLNINEILLLQDGHCFTNGILNICKASKVDTSKGFELASGSFETLIRLSNEGLGVTLLPFLHTLNLNENDKRNLIEFRDPKPSREISLIYSTTELKIHIIEALRSTISGIIKGAIAFQNIEIISPKLLKK